jgi:hypothetical protein
MNLLTDILLLIIIGNIVIRIMNRTVSLTVKQGSNGSLLVFLFNPIGYMDKR